MNIFNKVLLATALSALLTSVASATVVTFDRVATLDANGTNNELDALSIPYADFTVTAGISSINLAVNVNDSFTMANITAATVNRDIDPADGGLGVKSGVTNDTDNFEGSINNNTVLDEVLFFSFNSMVTLTEVSLNAGAGTGHQDLFSDSATDLFAIWSSTDGDTFTSLTDSNLAPTAGELLTIGAADQVSAKWFAVAHVGPVTSVGAYIESITYDVPEPTILALLGLGLFGMGVVRRKLK